MGLTLLLTQSKDPTSDYIQKAFKKKEKTIVRIDVDDTNIPIFTIDPIKKFNSWILDAEGRKINIKEIKAIIIRRPSIPDIHEDVIKNRFLGREIVQGLRSFLEFTNAIWMNHPDANSFASSKPRNLWFASKCGFKIPATLISSDNKEISMWLKSHNKCIIKAISYGLLEGKNSAEMAFTQRIPKVFNVDENMVPGVPMLFQEEVDKKADIRITVIGNKIFSAFLPKLGNEIDWRKYDENARWLIYDLPMNIQQSCLKLCNKLKLEFAAIDLVENLANEIFFLELNPNGQWVWIEEQTGLPISNSIVEHLTRS